MKKFKANWILTLSDGSTELLFAPDGNSGPAYTEEEWSAQDQADFELADGGDVVLFQGSDFSYENLEKIRARVAK